ncbi:MAG: hypothetical protein JWO82_1832 [Akkermansiaceae bacterium]|nr:hypothetical protein [Akkermansiaceae bacterium]
MISKTLMKLRTPPLGIVLTLCLLSCKEKTAGTGGAATSQHEQSQLKDRPGVRQKIPDTASANDGGSVSREILEAHGALSPEARSRAVDFFLHGDVEACKETLAGMPVGDDYNSFLMRFSQRYAAQDLPGAVDWLRSLPQGPEMQTAYILIGSAAARDPQLAETFLHEIKDPGLKSYFSINYVTGLANLSNWKALDEVVGSASRRAELGISTPDIVLALGGGERSDSYVSMSLGYLTTLLKDYDKPYNTLASTSIESLVGKNPALAADYVTRNADAKGVAEVFTGPLVHEWSAQDPTAAAAWLLAQSGKTRDYGAVGLVSSLATLQPQTAAEWAVSVTDPDLRQQAIGSLLRNAISGRGAVRSVIENSNISAAEKERYLKSLPN